MNPRIDQLPHLARASVLDGLGKGGLEAVTEQENFFDPRDVTSPGWQSR